MSYRTGLMYGDAGNDSMWGGAGDDWMNGGADNDIMSLLQN